MDWWLIALRVVHVGSAMAWFGGAVIGSFFTRIDLPLILLAGLTMAIGRYL